MPTGRNGSKAAASAWVEQTFEADCVGRACPMLLALATFLSVNGNVGRIPDFRFRRNFDIFGPLLN